ncbi:hypothetical protein DB31_5470 [Hyalangium minutum]|uniref:YdhG-like domain-containing protein n=2 Tax=Hyalangium minutum TaxID=394096 RepID=A0A085WRW5_9BACT|nr:hypothetical protein DB31_5470 [Hyalangium minutum]
MKKAPPPLKKKKGVSKEGQGGDSASQLIDARIQELGDWRGKTLARVRALIKQADPEVVEEWKWGVPVWSHAGIICTGESYKSAVKLTFAKGASVGDPSGLFNSSLEGNTRRAIDFHEGDKIEAKALKELIRAAVALNMSSAGEREAVAKSSARKATKAAAKEPPVRYLSGGNPQIAKGDGDAPVQAYIAAMPGWKHDIGRRLDALIVRTVPGVRKAVKWNSPFYGAEGQGWFLSLHCFTKYVKVAFFRGASLRPIPPGESKSQDTRYLDIHEGDTLDEAQFARWVKQASKLPGERM